MTSDFRILMDAYTQALRDRDTAVAEVLLKELDGLAISSQCDRARAEKAKGWTVG